MLSKNKNLNIFGTGGQGVKVEALLASDRPVHGYKSQNQGQKLSKLPYKGGKCTGNYVEIRKKTRAVV